ncbi:MAG TPA: dephospho-CoA kinase, partial [Bacteroidota bacterium]|nr:dephospho-CoA kinase [Bacteroidota bacterium]
MVLAIGITGGIGGGKTEVCRMFASLGAKVLSADAIAKEVIATDSQVRQSLRREFGKRAFLPDESLDRKFVADLAFGNDKLKNKLDSIVHPPTLGKIREEIQAARNSGSHPMVVVEAALMYESGADELFDYIIVVEADPRRSIERVVKR